MTNLADESADWARIVLLWTVGSAAVVAIFIANFQSFDEGQSAGAGGFLFFIPILMFSIPIIVVAVVCSWGIGTLALRALRRPGAAKWSRDKRSTAFAAAVFASLAAPLAMVAAFTGVGQFLLLSPLLFSPLVATCVAFWFYLRRVSPRGAEPGLPVAE